MRPPREVVIYCADSKRADLLAFVLRQTRTHRGIVVATPAELRRAIAELQAPGCVVLLRDRMERMVYGFLSGYNAQEFPEDMPVLQVCDEHWIGTPLPCDLMVYPDNTREVIMAIKACCRRKRGPKKRMPVNITEVVVPEILRA